MAIAFRDYSEASATGAALSIPKPAALRNRDVMLAHICYTEGKVPSAPSGWNRLNDIESEGLFLSVFWRTATDAEPPTFTWNFSGSDNSLGGISAYAGVNPAFPIITDLGWNSGYSKRNASLTLRKEIDHEAVAVSALANAIYQPHSPKNVDLNETETKTSMDAPRNDYEAPDHMLLSFYRRNKGTPYRTRYSTSANNKPRFLQVADQDRVVEGSSLYEEWRQARTPDVAAQPAPYEGNKVKAISDATDISWGCAHILLLRPAEGIHFRAASQAKGKSNIIIVPRDPRFQKGDFMIATVMVSETEDLIPGMPYGWNPLRVVYNEKSGRNTWYFWKIAGADEPDNYIWRLVDYYPNS